MNDICPIMDDINTHEHSMKSICRPAVAQWTKRLIRKWIYASSNLIGANTLFVYHTCLINLPDSLNCEKIINHEKIIERNTINS